MVLVNRLSLIYHEDVTHSSCNPEENLLFRLGLHVGGGEEPVEELGARVGVANWE